MDVTRNLMTLYRKTARLGKSMLARHIRASTKPGPRSLIYNPAKIYTTLKAYLADVYAMLHKPLSANSPMPVRPTPKPAEANSGSQPTAHDPIRPLTIVPGVPQYSRPSPKGATSLFDPHDWYTDKRTDPIWGCVGPPRMNLPAPGFARFNWSAPWRLYQSEIWNWYGRWIDGYAKRCDPRIPNPSRFGPPPPLPRTNRTVDWLRYFRSSENWGAEVYKAFYDATLAPR